MASIEEWGDWVDQGVSDRVAQLRASPMNFKDLTETLMTPPRNPDDHAFFLAMVAATALIRLASLYDDVAWAQ